MATIGTGLPTTTSGSGQTTSDPPPAGGTTPPTSTPTGTSPSISTTPTTPTIPSTTTTPSFTPTSSTSTSSTSTSSTTSSSSSSTTSSTITSTSFSASSTITTPATIVTLTSTASGSTPSTTSSPAAATSSDAASLQTTSGGGGSPANPKTIAVATVVPVVVVILAVLAGIWFWRKRRDRRNNEEMRRKEMEEYGFNPNNDPSLPPIGSVVDEEESSAGYRGWGTTSTARKASTNMSSQPAMARSDSGGRGMNGQPSPPVGGPRYSDGHSGDPLVRQTDGVAALGAVPAAGGNKSAAMTRGPSNASSTYSAGNYSDVSALSDGPLPNDGPQDYGAFVHPDDGHNGGGGWGGQPVIRDVSARRNTQIENSAHSPQQGSAGISQNF